MNILSLMDGMSVEEIGKAILGERDCLIRTKAQEILDDLMEHEICDFFADAANAGDGNFRNGYYSRMVNTAYGPLSLRVPRDRIGRFRTRIPAPYQRTTGNICELIQRLYIRGLTEREIVDQVMDDFGVSLSRETVRKAVNRVLGDAIAFSTRVVPDCPIVLLDGTYVPVRRRYDDTSRVQKECVMVALGIARDGRKVILGYCFTPNEGSGSWDDVLASLRSRGLHSPSLFVTDGPRGCPRPYGATSPSPGTSCASSIRRGRSVGTSGSATGRRCRRTSRRCTAPRTSGPRRQGSRPSRGSGRGRARTWCGSCWRGRASSRSCSTRSPCGGRYTPPTPSRGSTPSSSARQGGGSS